MTCNPYIIMAWIGGVCCSAYSPLYAAGPDGPEDLRTVEHQQNASAGSNAAFLTSFGDVQLSSLEASVIKENGDFKNYYQSPNSVEYSLQTESYYRLNPRVMLYGNICYSSFTGQDMGGSAFIDPTRTPFDIVETDEANRGRKRLETYCLKGALGYRASKRVSLGASIVYTAANYAKHKDLRHKNTLMDMQVNAGANWQVLPWLVAGASYHYHRNNEAIEFQTNGNKDIQYYSLISFGNFYGSREAFGETGFTSDKTPLFTTTHGGALQLQLVPRAGWKWFNEGYYRTSNGRFGTDASTDVTYTRHEGTEAGYRGRLTWGKEERTLHVVDASLERRKLTNNENFYRQSTDQSNVTQIVYYGSNEVLDRKEWHAQLAYTAYIGASRWIAGGEAAYYKRTNKTVIYPYFRKQDVYAARVSGFARRNIICRDNLYAVQLQLGYGKGGGTPMEDGLYATPGSNQSSPATREDLLMQEYEYYTASHSLAGIQFRYERKFMPALHGYVSAGYSYTHAYGTEAIGSNRHWAQFVVGCRF